MTWKTLGVLTIVTLSTLGGCGSDLGDVPRYGTLFLNGNTYGGSTIPGGNANDNVADAGSTNDNSDDGSDGNSSPGTLNNNATTPDSTTPELTYLRVLNYWGLPQEIYVDDDYLTFVEPGMSSDDIEVDSGFHMLCAYKIGKIDGVCEARDLDLGQVNTWLLTGDRPEDD